jgi:ferric-dicitrate binding protein FerR (iron transport regulator)
MNSEYLKYSIEELIIDESFIAWCKGDGNHDIWDELLKDSTFQYKMIEAKEIVLQMSKNEAKLDSIQKTQLWSRIDSSTEAKVIPITRRKWSMYSIAALASCFFLFFIFRSIMKSNIGGVDKTVIASQKGLSHMLPDESDVHIEQGSKITYNNEKFTEERTVNLHGRAFFNVQKGIPFKVVTTLGEVKVLGTSFDVIEKDHKLRVVCYTGRVEVTSGSKKVILTQGEETDFDTPQMKKISLLTGTMPIYVNGISEFHDNSLEQIISIFEQELSINIEAPADFKTKKFSGKINFENIDEALKTITWPYFYNFTRDRNNVIIKKNAK